MELSIRRAAPGDAGLLHDVAARTFELACPPGTLASDVEDFVARHLSAERFEGYLKDEQRILLLALAGDEPVGYSMLASGPIADEDVRAVVEPDGSIELSKFYVLLDRHGSGLAARLMSATLDAAAGTGATLCWLGVNQQNERAGRFYEKHGFTVRGVKRFLVGAEWHDDFIRARTLP